MNEEKDYKIWESGNYMDKMIVKFIKENKKRPLIITTDHRLTDLVNSVNFNVEFKCPLF